MRILIAADYYQTTIGYSKLHVPQQLLKRGHLIRVITSNKYFPFPKYKQTVEKILGSRERKIGLKVENGIPIKRKKTVLEIFSRCLFFGLKEEIKIYRPDIMIVYGVSSFSAIQASFLKKYFKHKLIMVDTHLPSEFESGNRTLKAIFYFIFRFLFSKLISNNVDKIIAAQEKTKEIITGVYGINKEVVLIDQGTDLNKFRFDEKWRIKLRENLQLKKNDFLIIYTGKVIPSKGVDILCAAFNLLGKKRKELYLLIVGNGEDEYLKKCISKIDGNILDRVKFVDFQPEDELFKYYSASDLAVWPLQETLSMNDAMACQLPFIANNTLGAKTRISGDNALLYKKGDIKDLAEKIEYIYNNPKLAKKMGRNGRKLAREKLSWEKIALEYIKL